MIGFVGRHVSAFVTIVLCTCGSAAQMGPEAPICSSRNLSHIKAGISESLFRGFPVNSICTAYQADSQQARVLEFNLLSPEVDRQNSIRLGANDRRLVTVFGLAGPQRWLYLDQSLVVSLLPVDTGTRERVVLVLRKSKLGKGTRVHLTNASKVRALFSTWASVISSVGQICQSEALAGQRHSLFPDIPTRPHKQRG